jgi:hypothetical protein
VGTGIEGTGLGSWVRPAGSGHLSHGRGTASVLRVSDGAYRIDEARWAVHVVRIDHRADVYRTRWLSVAS